MHTNTHPKQQLTADSFPAAKKTAKKQILEFDRADIGSGAIGFIVWQLASRQYYKYGSSGEDKEDWGLKILCLQSTDTFLKA